ncbi:MAG: biopolymer transporter ExbD [Magnetococcales bacterium]|nr:biopolymer transporter ExbD [Magnetococcales bacterium]
MQFRSRRKNPVSMDITPLVDVVFLLLIFFMVTTTFSLDRGIELELPSAQTAQPREPDEKQPSIRVLVNHQGRYYIQGEEIVSSRLSAALLHLAQVNFARGIIVQADKNSPFDAIISLMDNAQKVGLNRFDFITLEQREEESVPSKDSAP